MPPKVSVLPRERCACRPSSSGNARSTPQLLNSSFCSVVGKGGAPRKLSLRLSMSWCVYQRLGLQQPAIGEGPLVAQDGGITIDPVVIEGRGRLIFVVVELLDRSAGRDRRRQTGPHENRERAVGPRSADNRDRGSIAIDRSRCFRAGHRNGCRSHRDETRPARPLPGSSYRSGKAHPCRRSARL